MGGTTHSQGARDDGTSRAPGGTPARRHQAADEKLHEAHAARDELSDALHNAGVRLPSLSLDVFSYTGPASHALIELGRCNLETARALTAALRRGGLKHPEEDAR